jgi:hypothetical protein
VGHPDPHPDTGRAGAAIEFLTADIADVAARLNRLAAGVLDHGDGVTAPSIHTAASRSIPVHART